MADELLVVAELSYIKTGITTVARAQPTAGGDSYTQVTAELRYVNRVQNIGTSAELIGIGDVGTLGYCWMRNLDPTNFIKIRPGIGSTDLLKLKPEEVAVFRADSAATLAAIADTAACDLEYFIIED